MHSFFQTLRGKLFPEDTGKADGFLTWCAVSDIGRCRRNNEDNYLLDDRMNANFAEISKEPAMQVPLAERHLACLFDGMGGGEAGELAAAAAAEALHGILPELRRAESQERMDSLVRQAFLKANSDILAYRSHYQIFGTTGTVLLLADGSYKLYHLGDSRAYLYRNRELRQLTKDQNMAQFWIDSGFCKEGSTDAQLGKNQLTEFIGKDTTGKNLRPAESGWYTAQSGDLLLLCSDGMYDMCTREQIGNTLSDASDLLRCADTLVRAALEHGGQDNITCVLVRFP